MVRQARRLLGSIFDPPQRLRRGPFTEGRFKSALHSERNASLLGLALGVTFLVCFLTGVISHLIQQPPSWFEWPARPAGLYRVNQGVHVITGLASIPLLLAKLWTVYPRLWKWPPFDNLLSLVERISLLPLVGGSLFLLMTGLQNINYWYPWGFFFPPAHYWAAWITIGALVMHIGAKAAIVRRSLRTTTTEEASPEDGGLNRRSFLAVTGVTAAATVAVTVGEIVSPLSPFAVFAPRRPDVGPQGFPVNKSAESAGVTKSALDPGYRLRVEGNVQQAMSLSLEDLRSRPQLSVRLPISCVEGWSVDVDWKGIRVRDLLQDAGAPSDATVTVESLQEGGLYRSSVLNASHANDPDALLALEANGEVLHIQHGFPIRLITPNNPGVLQTKWVSRLVVG